jgi:hypothetical protein
MAEDASCMKRTALPEPLASGRVSSVDNAEVLREAVFGEQRLVHRKGSLDAFGDGDDHELHVA